MGRSAEDLHHAAVELVNRGSFAQAQRMLATAARRSDDPSVRARVAGTLAYILAARGDTAGAERICREALSAPGVDAHTRAILAGQMGALSERAGRLADAERWLTKGIQALADDPVSRANLLMNRSLVFMQQRRLSLALDDTVAATDTFAELGMPIDEAQSRHNEGYVALLGGDLITALQKMTRARDTLASLSDVAAAVGDVDRAEVLRDAGLTTEAEALLARAAAVFGVNRMRLSRAEAEFNLARSLLTHDPDAARRVARLAARRFDGLGNETWKARAHGVRLRAELGGGRLLRSGARAPEPRRVPPLAEVEVAASALDRLEFRSEAAALRMSFELWCARHGAPSQAPFVRVPKRASMEVRLLAHEVRAARAAADGRRADARRRAGRGLQLLSEWQSGFGSLDLQTSIAMHGNGLILAGLDSALRSRDPEVVFDWSERARMLSQQVVPLRPPPDPALAEELAELRMLRAEDPSALESERAAELRARARDRQWSATGSAAVQQRVSLDELRAELDTGTALVSYVFAELGLFALVITTADQVLLPLDDWPVVRAALPGLRADLDMSASMRGGGIGDVVRRSLDGRLSELSRALLDAPLAAAGGARRVVLTVPGVLSGIPWAMLPAMRGMPFTLAVSATRWTGLHAHPAPAPSSAGFVVGPRVARGDEEVDDASDIWTEPRILRERDASVVAVTALAHDVDVLHVAAHGRHAVDNPLFSGLELADGTLFGYDIDLIPDVPATVVLSACEVGRSSVRWGEEAVGMTRVWLHAGTRCVIASPVIVADDDACELLGVMHEGLVRGEPPAEALAAASARTGIVSPFQAHGAGF